MSHSGSKYYISISQEKSVVNQKNARKQWVKLTVFSAKSRDTKMESAEFSLTSEDGIYYSGTIAYFDEEFEITLRKKLN